MKSYVGHLKNSFDYAVQDKLALVILSSLIFIASLINKDISSIPHLKLFNVSLLIVTGYGSYVAWYTLKGRDEHPRFKNNLRRLIWEGFKKSCITFVYSGFLFALSIQIKQSYTNEYFLFALFWLILFGLVYLCLIAGLLNRYLHKGKILEAFNLVGIINLILLFDFKSFIKVIVAVVISQTFAVLVVIGFNKGFSLLELVFSILTFFLAPYLYIAMKRFIALNVYDLLEKRDKNNR